MNWTYHQWHLQQTRQFVLILHTCFRVDETALVRDRAIAAHEDVIGDGLSEDLDLEHVGDDLLGLAVDVRVDERDVVVACDDVAERGEPLFYALDRDCVGEGVAEVLELLVGGRRRYEETVSVSWAVAQYEFVRQKACCTPAVRRPIIRVPPMLVCTIGMTSPSSASNAE